MQRLRDDQDGSRKREGSHLLRQADAKNRPATAGGKSERFLLFGLDRLADGIAAVRCRTRGASDPHTARPIPHTPRAEAAVMMAIFTVREPEKQQSAVAGGFRVAVVLRGARIALGETET